MAPVGKNCTVKMALVIMAPVIKAHMGKLKKTETLMLKFPKHQTQNLPLNPKLKPPFPNLDLHF